MRKINWGILNIALWMEIILSYVLPFKAVDNFQYKVGFPIPFITLYHANLGVSPLMSMHLNPLGLLLNGAVFYLIISVCIHSHQKMKRDQAK